MKLPIVICDKAPPNRIFLIPDTGTCPACGKPLMAHATRKP